MRNHLYDVTNIAELIRWDVVITPDDQYVESEENTYIDGVFEDPDSILTRISYSGQSECKVIVDVLYTKEIDRLEVFIGLYKESYKASNHDTDAATMTSLIMQDFPKAHVVTSNDRKGYEVLHFWPNGLGSVHFKRLIEVVSLNEAQMYEFDDAQWIPTDVFDYTKVALTVSKLIGYGDFTEKGVPIPDSLKEWLDEAKK